MLALKLPNILPTNSALFFFSFSLFAGGSVLFINTNNLIEDGINTNL